MQNETQDFLSKFVPNDWRKIWADGQTHDEKLTATYIRAMENDCFEQYKPRYLPPEPSGWWDDYQAYKAIKDGSSKVHAWRNIQEKYKGYFSAKHAVEYQNMSDLDFLENMRDHFKKLNLPHWLKVQQRINEFNAVYPMPCFKKHNNYRTNAI